MKHRFDAEAVYAALGTSEERWRYLIGEWLVHQSLGARYIADVTAREAHPPLVTVHFGDEDPKNFRAGELGERSQIIVDEANPRFGEISLHAARLKKQREAEGEARRRTDLRAAELLREQNQRAEFEDLLRSYDVFDRSVELVVDSPVYVMLLRYREGSLEITDDVLEEAKKSGAFSLNAYLLEYRGNSRQVQWDIAKACAAWRDVYRPDRAILASDGWLERLTEGQASSAILTSRAAALADLGRFDESVVTALWAETLDPNRYHPCNVLVRAYAALGQIDRAVRYTARADELGSPARSWEREMQKGLRKLASIERKRAADELLRIDPVKFGFLRYTVGW